MTNSDFRSALWTWINSVINSPSGTTPIIWANGNGPRPTIFPYLSLNLIASVKKGSAWKSGVSGVVVIGDDGSSTIRWDVDATVSIQAYGKGGMELLEKIISGFERETSSAALLAAEIALRGEPSVKDLTLVLDEVNEPRYAMDLVFGFAHTETDVPGWIGDVGIVSEFNPQ